MNSLWNHSGKCDGFFTIFFVQRKFEIRNLSHSQCQPHNNFTASIPILVYACKHGNANEYPVQLWSSLVQQKNKIQITCCRKIAACRLCLTSSPRGLSCEIDLNNVSSIYTARQLHALCDAVILCVYFSAFQQLDMPKCFSRDLSPKRG